MSKRVWLFAALAAALVVAGGGAAFAAPSLDGPTGIVSVPNALVAPVGEVQGAVSWQRLANYALRMPSTPTGLQGKEDVNVWSLQVLSGVADRVEAWASYATSDDALDTNTWGLGGKVQIAQEPEEMATVAFGASFQRASGDARVASAVGMYQDVDIDTDVTKLYLVATKDFTPAGLTSEWAAGGKLLGSLGLLWAKAKADETIKGTFVDEHFEPDETLLRPFVAVEFVGAEGTGLGLEYRWKDSDLDEEAVFSAVLRHQFENGIYGELGTTNADPLGFGLGDQGLFARIGYTFGLGAP